MAGSRSRTIAISSRTKLIKLIFLFLPVHGAFKVKKETSSLTRDEVYPRFHSFRHTMRPLNIVNVDQPYTDTHSSPCLLPDALHERLSQGGFQPVTAPLCQKNIRYSFRSLHFFFIPTEYVVNEFLSSPFSSLL
jgi:hypothetical protein